MYRFLAVVSLGLAIAAGSCASGDESQEASSASAEAVIDAYIAAWNTGDPDAVVAMFSEEFVFKGLGPFEPTRTDAESLRSYATTLMPLQIRIERAGDLAFGEDGRIGFQAVISSMELDARLTDIEAEVADDSVTYMVTLDWTKTG